MRDRLFAPLGLGSTFAELPRQGEAEAAGERAEHLTKQYDYDISGRFVRVAPHITSHPGGSSMSSNVADLTRFAEMHLAGGVSRGRRILSERSVATMQDFKTPAKEPGVVHGNGWITHANLVRRNFNHSGGGPGATAMLAAFPDDGTVIAILSNHYGGMVTEVTRRVAEALFAGGKSAPAPAALPAAPPGPPATGRWRGHLRHHLGDIPLGLDILGPDKAEMRFARMPPVAMTQVSTASGFLGTRVGPLMRDAGYHGDSIIDFVLRVEDGRLIGIADTYAMNYFEVAFWVELDRAA
jgi:CubicO group peptidase (beta-lactamase class C family)